MADDGEVKFRSQFKCRILHQQEITLQQRRSDYITTAAVMLHYNSGGHVDWVGKLNGQRLEESCNKMSTFHATFGNRPLNK